ncbi:hypothetical protein AGOR_G00119840 [Albula goreensis]|uniref:Uncharacterized protein n=1 Tax=Albula goreensis TaxID=1534307 RepID=A0A8T3DKK9_9TELE|nr:hypothetical protein AGOR_G00119840 [Albula goreensis]
MQTKQPKARKSQDALKGCHLNLLPQNQNPKPKKLHPRRQPKEKRARTLLLKTVMPRQTRHKRLRLQQTPNEQHSHFFIVLCTW